MGGHPVTELSSPTPPLSCEIDGLRSGCFGGGGAGPFPCAIPFGYSTLFLVAVLAEPASEVALETLAPATASSDELLMFVKDGEGTGGGVLFLLLGSFGGLLDLAVAVPSRLPELELPPPLVNGEDAFGGLRLREAAELDLRTWRNRDSTFSASAIRML